MYHKLFSRDGGYPDEQKTYQIVGEDEFNVAEGKISWKSPLAKTLLGKKVGDEILTTFYYTTKPFKGDRDYPGIKQSDHIYAQIRGKKNSNGVQVDYTIFSYSKLKVKTIPLTPKVRKSQK